MTVKGTDWSHWNENVDYTPYDFIFHKATQGTIQKDSRYRERAAVARAKTKLWGAYLFMMMNTTPRAQVDYFANYADIRAGDMVALDFESDGTWSHYPNSAIADQGTQCMLRLRETFPTNRVLLYCNRTTYYNIVVAREMPLMDGLWIASPGVSPMMDWVLWQYGNGSVDYDRANFTNLTTMQHWTNLRQHGVSPRQQALQNQE